MENLTLILAVVSGVAACVMLVALIINVVDSDSGNAAIFSIIFVLLVVATTFFTIWAVSISSTRIRSFDRRCHAVGGVRVLNDQKDRCFKILQENPR